VASLVRSPAIYLDQDSLHDLAEPKPRRDRFLDIFKRKGTLMFSWTNVMDTAGPQGGTKEEICGFLDALGPFWIPLEMNPYKVVRKEQGLEPSSGTPCVSETFLKAYYPIVHGNTPTLARAVDLVHENRSHVLANTEHLKNQISQTITTFRSEYIKDPSNLDRKLPPKEWDAARPATFMLRELERLIVSEAKSYVWIPNDGVDFMHAAVAGAYSDLLVLDKQWKRRILATAPKRLTPWVFYRNELDLFLDQFEQCEVASACDSSDEPGV
jgi:hypothetical protein